MPFDTPPAIIEPAPGSPLLSEMIQRALKNPANQLPTIHPEPTKHEGLLSKIGSKMPSPEVLAPLLGGAADVISTDTGHGLHGEEQNPLLPQPGLGNAIALSGTYIGNALLTKYLKDHGHPKIAKVLGYAGAADGALSGLHNNGFFDWPWEGKSRPSHRKNTSDYVIPGPRKE